MQTSRLFEIIYILLHKKKVSAGELAEQLGVSRRTICRDIDTLSAAGIPVYTEKGKGGGISLLPEFVLNKSILSEQEQTEILSALHGLASVKTAETEQILQKLSTIFNKTTTNWLEVDYADWSHEHDYFSDFKTAILERRVAVFDYYNSDGDKTHRSVEPIQLWFKSKSWYLSAFCLLRQDMRLFKLARIKNLVVTDEHFPERDVVELSDDSGQEEQAITLKLRIAPEKAYRVFDEFYEDMAEKQPDGSFIVSVIMPETEWVYGFILSFGAHIEVLEPPHVRAVIKAEAEKIARKYL
ncbi:MAG: YafY family transcriptional regulator [Oscillospiraceae bacterium]|nr:YafY family transcriptional regulator [Oscillospiraceae bacterium]